MAKLKSMAFTKAETKERNSPKACEIGYSSGDKYPWGLRLDLNKETLKKLGLTDLPEPGATMRLEASVEVVSASINKRTDGEADRRIEVQITKMSIEPDSDGAVGAVNRALDDME